MRTSFKNSLFLFLFFLFAFWTGELTAQKHIAIDNKGTLKEITSSQVSTTAGVTPLNPNEGDVWIDTASNTVKIWEESAVPTWREVASIRNWISLSNSGVYGIDHLVSYNGSIYKNLTGTNSDTSPNLDVTNWKSIGGGDIVPLWKSSTNGGSYATNDIINYNGVLYKNTTGTNTDSTPNSDTTNWTSIGGGDIVPLWKSTTNGGSYATNDIINYNGVLYKNLTGTNTDSTPNSDTTNWAASGEKSVHYVSATRIESIGGNTTVTSSGIYRWDVTNDYGSVGFTVTNNNERFTPDRAGLYSVILSGRAGDNDKVPQIRIRMNGTRISGISGAKNDLIPHDSMTTHWIGYLSTTDYIEAEILHGWTGKVSSAQISILGL